MMRWIIGASLQHRLLVVATAAILMSLGIWQLPNVPVDLLPELAPPTIENEARTVEPFGGASPSMAIGLSSEKLSRVDLSLVAHRTVKSRLLQVPGVANVTIEPHIAGDARGAGDPDLLLVIETFRKVNTLQVTRRVEEALRAVQLGLPGVKIDSEIYRPAAFLETAFENLTLALILGAVLVVAVLGSLFVDWRTALISLVAIPLSLLAGLSLFYLAGVSLNPMVLTGLLIALGVVVDDAIVDVRNMVQRLRQHRLEGRDKSAAGIVFEASFEMRSIILSASLIVLLVVLPLVFVDGVTGAFIRPMILLFVLAALASTVVALTLTPALSLLLLSNAPLDRRESALIRQLQQRYDACLARAIQRPQWAYVAVASLGIASLATLPVMKASLLPAFKEAYVMIDWTTGRGGSSEELSRTLTRANREIQGTPGVLKVGAHTGPAVRGNPAAASGNNASQLWVKIDPTHHERTVAGIQEVVNGHPSLNGRVHTYLGGQVQQVLTRASKAIVVRLYGPLPEILRAKAEEVRQLLSGIPGIVDPGVEKDHETASNRMDVAANARGANLGAIAAEVERQLPKVEFPLEYHPELAGNYAERQASRNRIVGAGLAAAAGSFLVLQAAFKSWRLASAVCLALPAALSGGILAAFAAGGLLSLGSLLGLLGLLAIAVRHAVTQVVRYQGLRGNEIFGRALVLRGKQEQGTPAVTPIVMTTAATGAALLPVVLLGDIAGLEIVQPAAVVMLGGLVTSTLVSLLVIPTVYVRFGIKPEPELDLTTSPASKETLAGLVERLRWQVQRTH